MTEVYPILNSDTKCVYNANENNDMPSLEWETACDARLLKGLQLPWSKYPDTPSPPILGLTDGTRIT